MKRINKSSWGMLFTLLAAGLSGCAEEQDGTVLQESGTNEIRFAATADYTRGGDITTNNLTSFNVYAYIGTGTSPVLFMDNVTVNKTGTNKWEYSPVEYWPAEENVDFYAFAPSGWVGAGGPLKAISYDAYPGKEDIVYAVCPNMKGQAHLPNAQVLLNFRHALSKVTVKMSSTNTTLQVKVSNVALANIMTKGNFHFPSGNTAGALSNTTVGTWSDQNTPHTYMFLMAQTPSDVVTLTTTPTDMSDIGLELGGAKYMLPQELPYLNNGNGSDAYITVMCSIYDAHSGTKLWPNENTPEENLVPDHSMGDGLLKFPLRNGQVADWKQGYHYIYNLVINSNDEMGVIEFGNPTVDTYVDVETTYE